VKPAEKLGRETNFHFEAFEDGADTADHFAGPELLAEQDEGAIFEVADSAEVIITEGLMVGIHAATGQFAFERGIACGELSAGACTECLALKTINEGFESGGLRIGDHQAATGRFAEGDLVKLDVTIEKDGFMADAAETVAVGKISEESQRLVACAERAFHKAMLVARAGFRVSEIGRIVEREVRRSGFSVIRDLGGHGIGRTIHEEPRIPNYADPAASQILTEGLVITVEPIIAAGSGRAIVAKDGWTVCTADRRPSAHYEHTLVITKGEPILLTAA